MCVYLCTLESVSCYEMLANKCRLYNKIKRDMKKLFFGALAALAMVSCSDNKYSVTAVFDNGDNDGKMAYLLNYDTGETLDSAVIKNSCVRFEGVVETPFVARLGLSKGRVQFIVEPGDIAIDGKGTATGTALNDALEALSNELSVIMMDTTADESKKFMNYLGALDNAYEANKENPIGYYAFVQSMYYKYENKQQLDSALALAPAYYTEYTRISKQMNALNQLELTAEGKMFSDFSVKAADGSEQKLSDYVGKGNYVLVDFWASWCGPCRREIPVIKEILETHKDNGLTVLGVAVWDKVEDTKTAMEELEIKWPVILDAQSGPTDLYGISGIPHIILFAPDGTIVSRGKQGESLKAAVDEAMSK